ncbi:MAG: hypothetical protein M1457_07815 [bacterium]|nr:hypothetical protein [bacterium]
MAWSPLIPIGMMLAAGAATEADAGDFDSTERAARHAIRCDKPALSFFEGGVLGNGGMGVVVCTRPDAVVLRFGHNEVWDIRLVENTMDKLGTFDEVWEKFKQSKTDPEAKKYVEQYKVMAREPYSKPYPRPWPCGSLVLGFDRRRAELLGHRVRLDDGTCEVRFLIDGRKARLEVTPEMERDRLWLRMLDEGGAPIAAPFDRTVWMPEPGMPTTQAFERDRLGFRQVLAPLKPNPQKNRALRLTARLNGTIESPAQPGADAPRGFTAPNFVPGGGPFVAVVELDQGLEREIPAGLAEPPGASPEAAAAAVQTTRENWRAYWNRSGVALDDQVLESIWYRNLYFIQCSMRRGVRCPGLFGNWSWGKVGTAWHGDYHHNYNLQQPFWATFSSNHVDRHEPYVELVDFLMPVSRRWAREFYRLPGAYFPHSSYPVEMTVMPYPVPDWGWEVCETPWTVQSLWWHYLYTMDKRYLREKLFEPIKAATEFLDAYMRRPEAHGPDSPFKDGRFHIYPTVPPELYGLVPSLVANADCLVDLTLTRFVFKAYLEACRALAIEEREAALMEDVREILTHYPEYLTAESPRGTVFLDAAASNPETVYNTPNPMMAVFPGEEIGLHSPKDVYQIAANTWLNHRNEGGNELVFQNLQGARLGVLNLEKFKRQVNYCALPNGTCADLVLQVGGRYSEGGNFAFMADMGIWVENFSLPAVIDECLMQSYAGEIRLFPNWTKANGNARFQRLRAVGAFLVSAAYKEGKVAWARIDSEAGSTLTLVNPWPRAARVRRGDQSATMTGERLHLATRPGETILLTDAAETKQQTQDQAG